MQKAIWCQKSTQVDLTAEQIQAANGSRLLAQLLVNRGIDTVDAIDHFLNLEDYLPTSGLDLPDAQVGIDRMIKAIDGQENILIYGDFDVDGQTGTSIFYKTLQHLGAKVSFYIPDRATEGHGLNPTAVCQLVSSRQVKLLITTDTGITDFKEVSLLNGLGVDTIVTDHHDLPEHVPPSLANINPKCAPDNSSPLYNLCGAGVAYKLCELLLYHYDKIEILDDLLAIAAIGTVVDMMPLIKENRWMVWAGLQVLNRRQLVGVEALLAVAGHDSPDERKQLSSETIGFSIGPRLNALGRLEKADDGVKLLMTNDKAEAEHLAMRLDALNRQRQEMCEQTLLEAEQFLARTGGLNNEKAIVLASPDWHPGIIGLAATRLKDRYNVPIFLMIEDKAKDEIRCSARSIAGFHLHKELTKLDHYFLHFGGHAGAGGFALKARDFAKFKTDLLTLARNVISQEMCRPTLDVDATLQWHQLTPGLNDVLQALEPTGMGNPSPLFETEPLTVNAHRWMGQEKQHLKMILGPKEGKALPNPIDAICWRAAEIYGSITNDRAYRFVFSPSMNSFKGKETFQLMVRDMVPFGHSVQAENTVQPMVSASISSSQQSQQSTAPISLNAMLGNELGNNVGNTLSQPSQNEQAVAANSHTNQLGLMVVDHRQRPDPMAVVSQLLTQPNTRLFYEGVEPLSIPFFNDGDQLTRDTVNLNEPCDDLVLWGFPPSGTLTSQLLKVTKPSTVHVFDVALGAVVQPREVLKQLYRLVQTETAHAPEGKAVDYVTQFATPLGVTAYVVLAGLSTLQQIHVVDSSHIDVANETIHLYWQMNTSKEKRDLSDVIEFHVFSELLNEMKQFRQAVLTMSSHSLQQWLQLLSGSSDNNSSSAGRVSAPTPERVMATSLP